MQVRTIFSQVRAAYRISSAIENRTSPAQTDLDVLGLPYQIKNYFKS